MTTEEANAIVRHILLGTDLPKDTPPEVVETIRKEIEEARKKGYQIWPVNE